MSTGKHNRRVKSSGATQSINILEVNNNPTLFTW
jgi:hypothetical protein